MFGSSGAHELAYLSNAVLIALIRTLISNGTLSENQFAEVIQEAGNIMSPAGHTNAVSGAMRLLDDFKYRVAA
jgi:hypothetical protein